MQPPDQPRQETPGQPAFPGAGYPGYGPQPLPPQPAAPPYESAVPPYRYDALTYGQPVSASQTSGFAIASLVCSIAGWFLIPFVGGLLGVIFGHIARREIQRSQGWRRGNGLALAGLIVGYIHIAVVIVAAAFIILLTLAFASDGYRS